jgi:hypothetical protein
MDHTDEPLQGPEQYLKPGERLLKVSGHVRIKKFIFIAYITDRRVFLIDRNEKKPGITSKEMPREVIISSILESPGNSDPILVLSIKTTEDETRTMKIIFIQDGNDRTHEIEDWINILHGRPVRSQKHAARQRELQPPAHTGETARMKSPEKRTSDERMLHEPAAVRTAPPRQPAGHPEVQADTSTPAPVDNLEQAPETPEILFCHQCGRRVPAGANFCPYCGTKLHRQRTLPVYRAKKREYQED